ncbi:M23 family metallopeptidase [bacterium]|nr:M23 family metallopeptidase [bacterium]
MKKAKNKRTRYFALLFVPDQEQNPRSISMSYANGKMLIVIACVLVVHIVLGGFSYYHSIRLEGVKRNLSDENEILKVHNRKIEEIAREHIATKKTMDKIFKAFGTTLGVSRQDFDALNALEIPNAMERSEIPAPIESASRLAVQYQDRLPYLVDDEPEVFTSEHMPTRLPVEGFMTTRFQEGGWFSGRRHVGIDIASERGSAIHAAGKGVVIFADWTPDLGNMVVISHGSGYVSYYGHANYLTVQTGNLVMKGDIIALLGSSGISSAPHLHFEIWKDGQPIDPETFLYAVPQQSHGG